MAKRVVKSAYLSLGGTDYTSQFAGANLEMDSDSVDVTTLGDSGWRVFLQGLRKANLSGNAIPDSDLSGFAKTVWDAYVSNSSNTLAFELRADSAAVSAANPKFTGSVLITKAVTLPVTIGEALKMSFNWPVTGAVSYATS